jgi:hypothetical protein
MLHVDYAGPMDRETYLILVDATSKWVEAAATHGSTSSETTIKYLRLWFSVHGLPDEIVSDNGPCFTSAEFLQFLQSNGISHYKSPPYSPSCNGQAERTVQTVKHLLAKLEPCEREVELANILLQLRTTPSTVTGQAPCEILMGRKLQTMLSKLHPASVDTNMLKRNALVAKLPMTSTYYYTKGDLVYYRNYSKGQPWLPGIISDVEGPRNFKILSCNGNLERRHVNQLHRRWANNVSTPTPNTDLLPINHDIVQGTLLPSALGDHTDNLPELSQTTNDISIRDRDDSQADLDPDLPSTKSASVIINPTTTRQVKPVWKETRPRRIKKAPKYLNDFVTPV